MELAIMKLKQMNSLKKYVMFPNKKNIGRREKLRNLFNMKCEAKSIYKLHSFPWHLYPEKVLKWFDYQVSLLSALLNVLCIKHTAIWLNL